MTSALASWRTPLIAQYNLRKNNNIKQPTNNNESAEQEIFTATRFERLSEKKNLIERF